MLQPLFEGTTIPLLEKLAAFGERRHEVIAGNIANIDTPDYKTRDLPVEAFQKALRSAIAQRRGASSPGLAEMSGAQGGAAAPGSAAMLGAAAAQGPQAASIDDLFPQELFEVLESPQRNLTFQDAGNRSIEAEFMEMTKNNLTQNFAVELMQAQMALLQAVIREQA